MDGHKKLIAKIGAVFVGVLLFLTFFSNTIANFNLPSVTVDFTKEGVLTKYAEGRAVVEYVEKDMYYAEFSGRITLLVSAGETVKEDDELYTIEADVESLMQMLDDYTLNEERIKLRLERATADTSRAQEILGNFINEATEFDPSEYDFELQRLQTAVEVAQRDFDDFTVLYEAGSVSLRELEDMQAALESLDSQLQLQRDRMGRAQDEHARSFRDRRRDLERAVADSRNQIREQEFELSASQRETEKLREQIEAGGIVTVLAERFGSVREIRFDTGMYVSKNEPIIAIGAADGGFKADVHLPESVDYISVGDTVMLEARARGITNLQGEINSLIHEDGVLKAEVRFRSSAVRSGETVELRVSETSRVFKYILPNAAVRNDGPGSYYLLYTEMVEGSSRNEYFARRLPVEVLSYDNINTAISISSDERLPFIINSDRAVSEGDKIRIVGESDFEDVR